MSGPGGTEGTDGNQPSVDAPGPLTTCSECGGTGQMFVPHGSYVRFELARLPDGSITICPWCAGSGMLRS